MKELLSLLLIMALSMVSWTACSSAEEADKAMLLLGQWDIAEAYRNGRPTESLRGLYFVFTPDGDFRTNLNGEAEEGRYELRENSISTSEVQLSLDYQIVELGDSNLILQSSFQIYQFYFKFKRAAKQNDHSPS